MIRVGVVSVTLFSAPSALSREAVPEEVQEVAAKEAAQEATPQEATGHEGPGAPEAGHQGTTQLHVLVFVGATPAADVSVTLAHGAVTLAHGAVVTARTNENGSAELVSATEGARQAASRVARVGLTVPRALVPEAPGTGALRLDLGQIRLVAGQTAELVATLRLDGTVESLLVEGAEASEAREARQEAPDEPSEAIGTLVGVVRALETKAPVVGAKVYVRGAPVEAVTDEQGRFRVELPEGTWDLSVIHTDYSTESRSEVVVDAARTREIEIELAPSSVALDDFVVTAPHIEGSVAAYMDERRESASLTDAITSEDISRTPAGDAAGAAQRVVGVTIVDGRFVYVRGLGERYTNALVNGSTLPSPEPDRATVPLDLFPTQTIRSIDIAKTFTPDMPADFAGGSVRIETITVPERLLFNFSLKAGWNSQATFRHRLSYDGGSTDWLGIDDGHRALPDEVPRDYALAPGQRTPEGDRIGRGDIDGLGPAFDNPMNTTRAFTPPHHGGTVMLGNGWDLGRGARLGAVGALTYGRKYTVRDELIREFIPTGEGGSDALSVSIDARRRLGRESVRWGSFGIIGLELGEHHAINLLAMRSQLADDTTSVFRGYLANNDGTVGNSRLDFTSRTLDFAQLRGVHAFPELHDAELDWRLSLAKASMSQPDMRDAVYFRGAQSDTFAFLGGATSGRHFYADMDENAQAVFVDWTQPILRGELPTKLKVGGAVNTRERIFGARRFSFRTARGADDGVFTCGPEFDSARCPGDLFVREHLGGSPLELLEDTNLKSDAYSAETGIYAGYLMGDSQLTERWRLIGGARLESTRIFLAPYDQFARREIDGDRAELESVDVLPSLSVVYALSESLELRGAVSRTLARPQLRELASFTFQDYYGGALVAGDPNLRITKVVNADLRADYFPSPQEVVSISAFAKDFTDPLEPVLEPSSSLNFLRYRNARGAFLIGVEIEARKSLEFIDEALEDFSLMGNLTLTTSRIRLDQTGADATGVGFLTNTERAMVNQAPYVVNIALDYSGPSETNVRLLYNTTGKRIVRVGTAGLDDYYLQPQHQVDLTVSREVGGGVQIGFSAENILNTQYLVTQGRERRQDRATHSYRNGVVLSLSAGYSY